MEPYDHKKIEKKWQEQWEKDQIYKTAENSSKPKQYVLDMFPYPSGEGLHVGHPKGYIATDIYSRMKRMQGFNVLHPMGWDAFGLPAENYAIKNKVHPHEAVTKNIARFKEQLSIIGFDYDWSREIDTTDPKYYKWTQWIFLKLLEKGLAFESYEPINWCPSCQTGLANEDLDGGRCERCNSEVEKKPMRQWVLKITDYADRLIKDLDLLHWPDSIKTAQLNWIGRSEGHEVDFAIAGSNEKVTVFTTRLDTIYGATYLVLAPEHPLVENTKHKTQNSKEIQEYVDTVKRVTEIDRTAENKEKTGVELKGIKAINPASGAEIPVWIADYVLGHYGTGAIMAVPAHDERDAAFAKKFNLPTITVVQPLVTKIGGSDAFRANEKVSERHAMVAVVKHWSENKYLLAHWLKTDWKGFVIGGIEEGESLEAAGIREVQEETGYKHVRFVRPLGETVHARFWQGVKNENRFAHFEPALFELISGERTEPTEEEKALHNFSWLTPDEMSKTITHDDMGIIWNRVHAEKCAHNQECEVSSVLVNSGNLSGLQVPIAIEQLEKLSSVRKKTTYKLRDWVFSRQRYWGEPIPVVHCLLCGVVPVSEDDLPITLPPVEHYAPTGTGESPLANIDEWVNTVCPHCGGAGKRETNTMPQWAGSSWYYLRYMDPHNEAALVSPEVEKYWAPVDVYVGGDHAVRHLIYARFWHKFLNDIGVVSTAEPFARLEFLGFILAEDGRKMAKRWGNVINPDTIVETYGADSLRLYEMFMGPFENAIAWQTKSIIGVRRFLERVWNLQNKFEEQEATAHEEQLLHQMIQKVATDIEAFKFNTAVSAMMIFVNEVEKLDRISSATYLSFLQLLAPFAPHMTEEIWRNHHSEGSIHSSSWPTYDSTKATGSRHIITIQINGKMRGLLETSDTLTEEVAVEKARELPAINKWLGDKKVNRVIYIPDKLINLVTLDRP